LLGAPGAHPELRRGSLLISDDGIGAACVSPDGALRKYAETASPTGVDPPGNAFYDGELAMEPLNRAAGAGDSSSTRVGVSR